MGNFFDVLKEIITIGIIRDPLKRKRESESSELTNQILLDELVAHFDYVMKIKSVGKRLLYPMSFNILMHPDDYNSTKESFPFILPEVVSAFYKSIKRKKKAYPNYSHPASYWFFQFSACQIKSKDGEEDFIKRGEIVTTASLTTFDIRKAQQEGVRSEANVQLSVKCTNSKTDASNINMEALLGMDILSEGVFTFDFDETLNEDTTLISATTDKQRKGWATLRWAAEDGSGNNKVYDMFDAYIEISGKAETRTSSNIVRINSDAVMKQHVLIKYDPSKQTFLLAAFAKTRLNEREVPLSTVGAPQWVTLAKFNSHILLNDAVNIEFNANSDLV